MLEDPDQLDNMGPFFGEEDEWLRKRDIRAICEPRVTPDIRVSRFGSYDHAAWQKRKSEERIDILYRALMAAKKCICNSDCECCQICGNSLCTMTYYDHMLNNKVFKI